MGGPRGWVRDAVEDGAQLLSMRLARGAPPKRGLLGAPPKRGRVRRGLEQEQKPAVAVPSGLAFQAEETALKHP